ncbi:MULTISPECIES: glycosyltransferase [Microbispora]|uniref:Glycosyltransferase n=1 Tax=Microbispora hainanensis TaxID=568844 RepID=A0ABZ1SJF9_9ACTN|nr:MULTISPECIES: glycosyltransferase [Microbispora]
MTADAVAPQAHPAPSLAGRAAPEIGIGLCVYNGEPYLSGSLASILAQDGDFDLVIADNCSTDATEEICREAARKDPRVRYIRRDRNLGVIANHNQIVHETRGEFFSFASSDDEYREDRLTLLAAALRAVPDASIAFSGAEEIDADGELIKLWRNTAPTDHPDPVRRLHSKLVHYDETLQFYGLMRRSLLERALPLQPIVACDRVLIAQMALLGPMVAVDDPLLRHRNHAKSVSRANHARAFRKREKPEENSRFFLPNVAEGAALARAIRHTPLSPGDRLRAYAALSPWLRRNAVPMARNVAHVAVGLVRGRAE